MQPYYNIISLVLLLGLVDWSCCWDQPGLFVEKNPIAGTGRKKKGLVPLPGLEPLMVPMQSIAMNLDLTHYIKFVPYMEKCGACNYMCLAPMQKSSFHKGNKLNWTVALLSVQPIVRLLYNHRSSSTVLCMSEHITNSPRL